MVFYASVSQNIWRPFSQSSGVRAMKNLSSARPDLHTRLMRDVVDAELARPENVHSSAPPALPCDLQACADLTRRLTTLDREARRGVRQDLRVRLQSGPGGAVQVTDTSLPFAG